METTERCLRNHIPLGAPATREPCIGDEPRIRVSLGFTPTWYRSRLGIDFGEQWHTDPDFRYQALLSMKEQLHASFPEVSYFTPRYRDGIEPTCATISGVYGIMVVPSLYGLPIRYAPDNWPDVAGGAHLSKEALTNMKPIDLDAAPTLRSLERQMMRIEQRWGTVHGYLNYQGVLNVAMKLRGSEVFMDMIDDPPFAHGLFTHIADTIRRVSQRVQARQRKSGFHVDLLSMSNCVINMVSPDLYSEFLLPLDLDLSKRYARFGVHTCNWNATPYFDALSQIEDLGYLDTGMQADLARMRRQFPDTRRAVMYSPVRLEQASRAELRADIERLNEELAPCDLVMADVEDTIKDERVRDLLRLVTSVTGEPAT
jgi:hypothetical protein